MRLDCFGYIKMVNFVRSHVRFCCFHVFQKLPALCDNTEILSKQKIIPAKACLTSYNTILSFNVLIEEGF